MANFRLGAEESRIRQMTDLEERMFTEITSLRARLASVERERDEIMAMAERRDGELQARLAEAERLLDEAEQWLGDNDDEEATSRRIRKFLRATDSAGENERE